MKSILRFVLIDLHSTLLITNILILTAAIHNSYILKKKLQPILMSFKPLLF